MVVAIFGGLTAQVLTWSEGWRPVYIHQMNRVNSRNDFVRLSVCVCHKPVFY